MGLSAFPTPQEALKAAPRLRRLPQGPSIADHGHGPHLRVQIAGHVAPRRQLVSGVHSSRQQVLG
jgi:hypothetical protein